jgi:hypothetical protein
VTHVLVLIGAALLCAWLPVRMRRWALLATSVLAVYWLPSGLSISRCRRLHYF